MHDAHRTATVAYVDLLIKTTGLDLTNLARKAGLSSTTLTRFRNNPDYKNTLSARTLKKLSDATGVPLPPGLGGSAPEAVGRGRVAPEDLARSIEQALQQLPKHLARGSDKGRLRKCASLLARQLSSEFMIVGGSKAGSGQTTAGRPAPESSGRQNVVRRVSLSAIGMEDSETLFRWINDPETVHFNVPYKPVHWANHEEWVRSLGKTQGKMAFAIRADGHLVGVVQLIDIDPVHRSAELTIRIGDEANRGRGVGTQALKLALDSAWRDLNLHRVWLRVSADNAHAIRAYKKAGFVEEGRLRDAAHIDGKYVDVIVLGILRQ